MSYVRKINGYNIKDEEARDSILNLENDITSLQEKSEKTAEVHFIYRGENGGDANIIKTKNKTVLIDFGIYDYVSDYIDYLIDNDITKIDYVNISHFDNDHTATLNGFRNIIENSNLDFSECIFLIHQAPNWASYTGDLTYQTRYEEIVDYLTENNYIIKYPTEEEVIELDEFNKLKFYNVDTTFYSDYLTSVGNAFSVYIELISNKKHILFTGDGIEVSENNITDELEHIDLLKIPHHGVEKEHSVDFMERINPDTGVIMNTTDTYTNRYMFRFFKDNNKTLYTTNESGNVIALIVDNEIIFKSDNGTYSDIFNNVITLNTDLNDITKTGIYQCNDDTVSASLSNMPYNYGTEHYHSQFLLNVVQITSYVLVQTMYTLNADNIIWTRKNNNGTWTEWQKYRISTFNFLRAKMTDNKAIPNNTWNTLTLDDSSGYVINNALTLDTTNNTIKIGKGVHHVQVSAQATWNSLTNGDRVNFSIYKGSDRIMSNDSTASGGYFTQTISPIIMTVNENDTIKLQARNLNSTTSLISKASYDTFLEVSVID